MKRNEDEGINIEDENRRIGLQLAKLEESVSVEQSEEIQSRAFSTFTAIKWLSIASYMLGALLIVVPLLLIVVAPDIATMGVETFGITSLGIVDLLALIFYKPMDRIQRASGDFTQHMMIYSSWAMIVKMLMKEMKWKEGNLHDTVELLSKYTKEHVESIQTFI
ncbi:MAG: hypothetical protein P1Q69_06010 [Candidatus Thorarchaeota archaeon]|nr:hypothetical protein [Candidatus Thorarchaeota archaeon]